MLVDYNGFQSWCYRSTIKRSQLTCILGLRNKEFKYQIGDIYKNENADFIANDYLMMADIDLGRIRSDRMRNKSFTDTTTFLKGFVNRMTVVDLSKKISKKATKIKECELDWSYKKEIYGIPFDGILFDKQMINPDSIDPETTPFKPAVYTVD